MAPCVHTLAYPPAAFHGPSLRVAGAPRHQNPACWLLVASALKGLFMEEDDQRLILHSFFSLEYLHLFH